MTTGSPLSPPFKMLFRMRPPVLALALPLALALACAGCTPAAHTPLHLSPAVSAPDKPWWQNAGDPLLAQFIEQGLAHDPALSCQAAAIAARDDRAAARRIRARLTRLVAPRDAAAARLADTYTLAQSRSHLAATIALAYIEARRWQARIALRAQALAPLRDNAEIAHFRREAGLVSALDGDMADVMTGLDGASVEAARAHLSDAIADLARLTGALPEDLRVLLGPDGHVPSFAADPDQDIAQRADLLALNTRLTADLARRKASQADIDTAQDRWHTAETQARAELQAARDALTSATARLAPLDHTEALATRALGDARLAYRGGTESFATLYVTEGVALATHERRIDTNAALATAAIALWSAQGLGWQNSDLKLAGAACVQP